MKLQDQVCTLEKAKKLKELGVEQKVLWQWKVNNVQSIVISTPMAFWIDTYFPTVGNVFYSAFNVAELGAIVGDLIKTKKLDVPDEITEKYAKCENDFRVIFNPNLLAK